MESRELRVAVGLRRWSRYAMAKRFMGTSTRADFERLHRAAEKAHGKLGFGDRSAYLEWAMAQKKALR